VRICQIYRHLVVCVCVRVRALSPVVLMESHVYGSNEKDHSVLIGIREEHFLFFHLSYDLAYEGQILQRRAGPKRCSP